MWHTLIDSGPTRITFPVSGIVEVGGERSWFSIFDVKIKLTEERGI